MWKLLNKGTCNLLETVPHWRRAEHVGRRMRSLRLTRDYLVPKSHPAGYDCFSTNKPTPTTPPQKWSGTRWAIYGTPIQTSEFLTSTRILIDFRVCVGHGTRWPLSGRGRDFWHASSSVRKINSSISIHIKAKHIYVLWFLWQLRESACGAKNINLYFPFKYRKMFGRRHFCINIKHCCG